MREKSKPLTEPAGRIGIGDNEVSVGYMPWSGERVKA
jgi:hypothetical protein